MVTDEALKKVNEAAQQFISNYREALPRVALRGMRPFLDALCEAYSSFKLPNGDPIPVPLCRYYLDNEGRQTAVQSSTVAFIVYQQEKKMLGWTVMGMEIGNGMVVIAGLPGFRDITMEDVVELGFTPVQLVESACKTSEMMRFVEASMKATQPMASA